MSLFIQKRTKAPTTLADDSHANGDFERSTSALEKRKILLWREKIKLLSGLFQM